ncbi:MAG: adenylate/guanylate cyclase domain-containing protein [Calditrichaeota bacterium]|nr:adenylate/guanylate cyclase domain-containing protein [Calditrichota bacterium]
MKWLKKSLVGAGWGIAAALLVWLITRYMASDLFYTYEAKTYDWRIKKNFEARPTIDDVIIVDIDGRANKMLGKYSQWPREYHKRIVDFLHKAGAAAIALDILYDKDIWQPQQDVEFVKTVKRAGNVYTAIYFAEADSDNWQPVMKSEPEGFDAERFYYTMPPEIESRFRREDRFESGFVELLNASRGVGHVNFNADVDGVVRRIHLFTNFNHHLYPTLGFKIFLDAIGSDSLYFDTNNSFLNIYREGEFLTRVPVDQNGNMLINWVGPFKSFRYISFYDVLNAEERNLPPEIFQGRMVLLGASLAGLFDLRNVPFQRAFPGVEIHANILYTLLSQNFITKMKERSTFLLLILLGIILGIIFIHAKPLASIITILVIGTLYVVVVTIIFFQLNYWVEIIAPLLTIVGTFSLIYVYRYVTEEKDKRFIRSTFSHFVTKSVVDELLSNPDKIKLGGEKKLCTVLFSDVAGFTTISEQLEPEELVQLLNEYLTEMTNIVFKYEGMLDKYEGDAIMAVFGAPVAHGNHAYHACATALEMQERLVTLREVWRQQGRPELYIRIGINTGMMVVGNMGSESRFDYTVMGDAVNLGARLEPANKIYNTSVMIGEKTYQMAKDLIIVRPLDLLRVKGKTEPVQVYELIGLTERGVSDEVLRTIDLFKKGFVHYLKQEWDAAINYFQQILTVRPSDGPARCYLDRCEYFKDNPPGADWDGVYSMKTK